MNDRFTEWENEIKQYCEENNLSFEKAKTMAYSYGYDCLKLLYYERKPVDYSKGINLDKTPVPKVLIITKEPDGLKFEQTEYTQQYLGLDP